MYFLYIIKNTADKLYVGVTKNLVKRVYYHNTKQGAQFTRSGARFETIFVEEYATLTEARKREIQIKKWRRDKKEMLIERYRKGLPSKI